MGKLTTSTSHHILQCALWCCRELWINNYAISEPRVCIILCSYDSAYVKIVRFYFEWKLCTVAMFVTVSIRVHAEFVGMFTKYCIFMWNFTFLHPMAEVKQKNKYFERELCRFTFYKRIKIFFFLVAPTLGSLLPLLEYRAEFPQFLDQGQSVGLLGRVISSPQGLYLYTNTEKRTYTHKH
jgi:hypothetical protein